MTIFCCENEVIIVLAVLVVVVGLVLIDRKFSIIYAHPDDAEVHGNAFSLQNSRSFSSFGVVKSLRIPNFKFGRILSFGSKVLCLKGAHYLHFVYQ